MSLLETIDSPDDLKSLSIEELHPGLRGIAAVYH